MLATLTPMRSLLFYGTGYERSDVARYNPEGPVPGTLPWSRLILTTLGGTFA